MYIGEAYGGNASQVPHLMRTLSDWLESSSDHPLVRAALLHLNVLAIHPWIDGNGRNSRVLPTLELLRAGVRAPELGNIEPYLASNRAEYIAQLRAAHGRKPPVGSSCGIERTSRCAGRSVQRPASKAYRQGKGK